MPGLEVAPEFDRCPAGARWAFVDRGGIHDSRRPGCCAAMNRCDAAER